MDQLCHLFPHLRCWQLELERSNLSAVQTPSNSLRKKMGGHVSNNSPRHRGSCLQETKIPKKLKKQKKKTLMRLTSGTLIQGFHSKILIQGVLLGLDTDPFFASHCFIEISKPSPWESAPWFNQALDLNGRAGVSARVSQSS